jgi:hypothetical protein
MQAKGLTPILNVSDRAKIELLRILVPYPRMPAPFPAAFA